MDRSRLHGGRRLLVLLLMVGCLLPSTGCVHQLFATVVYMWTGGLVPGEYEELIDKRVVVVCRPPSSLEYRHAGAARDLSRRVGILLANNVEGIDVVDAADVDNWADENDWDNFRDLASSLNAQAVVHIELEEFSLYKGPTLLQGNSDVTIAVYDMEKDGDVVWEKPLGQVLFPVNSAVPVQEKALPTFRKQFIGVLSEQIASHFYEHDPRYDFALDATAHR